MEHVNLNKKFDASCLIFRECNVIQKESHALCGVFHLTFIATLVVFKHNCLTDYLFCVGLIKVKPSFTDQKKFKLNKIQMARADCKQIVSQ